MTRRLTSCVRRRATLHKPRRRPVHHPSALHKARKAARKKKA